MNINPKKNWHVRSKTNIARVKADEAAAAERDRVEEERVRNAEQEARIRLMRGKARERVGGAAHENPMNLFFGGEDGKNQSATNREHEAEKKAEKEKEEKAIGLLTYLGQSVIDAQHSKPWWSQPLKSAAKRSADPEANKLLDEWETKKKQRLDPLSVMSKATDLIEKHNEKKRSEQLAPLSRDQQTVLDKLPLRLPDDIDRPREQRKILRPPHSTSPPCSSTSSEGRHRKKKKKKSKKKKDKKEKKEKMQHYSSRSSTSDIEALRAERLKREKMERNREVAVMQRFCLKQMGEAPQLAKEAEPVLDERKMPYNSAFNPELSRQMNPRRKRTTEELVEDLIKECRR